MGMKIVSEGGQGIPSKGGGGSIVLGCAEIALRLRSWKRGLRQQ